MPPKKKNARTFKQTQKKKIFYPCYAKKCAYGGVETDEGDPAPINCLCGASIDNTAYYSDYEDNDDDDDDDYIDKSGDKSPRPSWRTGRREELTLRQSSPGGTLTCAICKKEIETNSKGKEVWYSKSGKKHMTLPPIDHFGGKLMKINVNGGNIPWKGDWAERKDMVRSNKFFQSLTDIEQKQVERDVYNSSPLRIAHLTCNCSRPKFSKK